MPPRHANISLNARGRDQINMCGMQSVANNRLIRVISVDAAFGSTGSGVVVRLVACRRCGVTDGDDDCSCSVNASDPPQVSQIRCLTV